MAVGFFFCLGGVEPEIHLGGIYPQFAHTCANNRFGYRYWTWRSKIFVFAFLAILLLFIAFAGMFPCDLHMQFDINNLDSVGFLAVKMHDYAFINFESIRACDRQTDEHGAHSYYSRSYDMLPIRKRTCKASVRSNKKCGQRVRPTRHVPARLWWHRYSILFPEYYEEAEMRRTDDVSLWLWPLTCGWCGSLSSIRVPSLKFVGLATRKIWRTMCVSINEPGDPDLWPFDLETGTQVASEVGKLLSKFGHARPFGSRIICYIRDGRTDRRMDGRTNPTLIAP